MELVFWYTNTIDLGNHVCKYILICRPSLHICDNKGKNLVFPAGISPAYNLPGKFIITQLCTNMDSTVSWSHKIVSFAFVE